MCREHELSATSGAPDAALIVCAAASSAIRKCAGRVRRLRCLCGAMSLNSYSESIKIVRANHVYPSHASGAHNNGQTRKSVRAKVNLSSICILR